jgi:HEAT repeat protein
VTDAGPVARAAEYAALGHRPPLGSLDLSRLDAAVRDDPDPRVRAAALGALMRAGDDAQATAAWSRATADSAAGVRRRACELTPELARRSPSDTLGHTLDATMRALTDDTDVTVVETAAWALGELDSRRDADVRATVTVLSEMARGHRDPLAREAAVAALGAIGDPTGLPAILAACHDKPAVRRRAVLALAPFAGPEVDAAIEAALTDRDWQVRQAAEDLRDA